MNYVGENAVGWLLLPALLVALCLGLGLLTSRLLRVRFPAALLAPIGLCVAIVVVMPLYGLGLHGWLPPGVVAVAALAGLVLKRAELRSAFAGPALAAGGFAYLVYMAPVVLSGDWTWTGYNFVNDTAVQLALADYVTQNGAQLGEVPVYPGTEVPLTTHDTVMRAYFLTSYPLGSHELLGALSTLLQADVAVLYQPYLALLAGFGAMALTALATRSGLRPWRAAALAGIAAIAGLLYQYGLQGNVKELAFFAIFATAAALARELLDSARPVAVAAALGIAGGAAVSVYSAAALPYLGILAVVLVVARAVAPRERRFGLVAVVAGGLAAFVVAGLTALTDLVSFAEAAQGVYSGEVDEVGHLLRPLPTIQAAGVWLSGNYREAIADDGASIGTTLASWTIVALLVAGVAYAIRRREPGPLMYLLPAAVTFAFFVPRVATYADAKMLVALTPTVLFAAGFGLLWARRGLLRLAGLAVGATLAALVVVTAALAYHDVQLAPTDRMKAIEDITERLPRDDVVLWNESDEFVKYFARSRTVNVAFENVTPRRVKLLREARTFGEHFDLDEQRLDYVQSFRWIVKRRAPDASRPPTGYELVATNRFYEVWRRRGAARARAHLPLQAVNQAALAPQCDRVRAFAQGARPGERLVAAERRPPAMFDVTAEGADRPPGWPLNGLNPGTVTTAVPGRARGSIEVDGGAYDVWLRGSFGRPMIARVDGREIGKGQKIDGRRQWRRIARIELDPGRHDVELFRGGGTLAPGDGNPAYSIAGPLAFVKTDEAIRLREVDPRDARDLCGGTYDWLEIVRR